MLELKLSYICHTDLSSKILISSGVPFVLMLVHICMGLAFYKGKMLSHQGRIAYPDKQQIEESER